MRHGTITERSRSPQTRGAAQSLAGTRGRQCRSLLITLALLGLLPGCVTPWEKYALMKEQTPNIEKVAGPTERRLRLKFWEKQVNSDGEDTLKPLVGTEDYLAATELYKDEEFAQAQKAFQTVAKKYKKSGIREDALFMQAESAFQQEHYSKAHDTYAILLKEYPSTRHLDVVSERLFKIGRLWLDFPEVAKLSEIQQVNYDDPKQKLAAEEPPKPNKTPVFVPNFTNKERPLFDAPGNGVAALQAIWMNDPTGPLADDAMMLVASHHSRMGNYVEADRHFRMLRETFPNSPHLQDAFLIGSHVKLMSYQGADYDGKTLNDAQMLKESTLRLYPNIADRERLKDELAKIQAARAEREWVEVQLWMRKGNKRAASVKCHQLISQYPESSRAEQARAILDEMGPEFVSGAVLLNPLDPPKGPLWRRMLGMQPSYVQAPTRAEPATSPTPYAGETNEEQSPSRWSNPFKRRGPAADEPVDEPEDDAAASDAEAATPRKRSRFWPAPRRLPDEGDSEASELDADDTTGRAKL